MRSLNRLLLLALPLVGRVACTEPASPVQETKSIYVNPNEVFQELLNALPEESLHVALNSLEHFRAGVFESVRHGVESVHNENPPLATRLIVAAVQDLKKRQTPSNTTTQSAVPSQQAQSESQTPSSIPTSSPLPSSASSRASAVIVPVPISTTDSNGKATVVSSAILSQPTASVATPVTRTNANGQTFVSQETKPAVIFTATDTAGSAFVTTSAVDFAPTQGQVMTATNSQGRTFVTTYTPGGGVVSSIVLITTTGSDGRQSVITSFTVIVPMAATGTNGQPIASATSGKPGLQTGAAVRNRAMDAAVVGGAVGGALALWI